MTSTTDPKAPRRPMGSLLTSAIRMKAAMIGGVLMVAATGFPACALTITPIFDSTWNTAPSGDLAAAEAAFANVDQIFGSALATPVNVKIDVSWGQVAGSAMPGSALGATSVNYVNSSLNTIETLLTNAATANPTNTALLSALPYLPASVSGASFIIPAAQYAALTGSNLSGYQAYIGFGSATNWQFSQAGGIASNAYDFTAVVAHEVAHALGRVNYEFASSPPPYLTPLDLFRYNCGSTTLNQTTATAACFSLNGGTTDLQTFSNTSDTADWYGPSGSTDASGAYLAPGVTATLSSVDFTVLNALGFAPAAAATQVPEPAAILLLGVGIASLGIIRRGRRSLPAASHTA